jgi:3-hydroxyacyl-[acyl-carrier-protein] dehydratase
VKSEKIYFRFGKLKCKVVLENEKGEVLSNGTIAGMISK